jgi:hypothetical protein
MAQKVVWTPKQDNLIRQLRTEGATWDAIATALSASRFSIVERGRRLGARRPPPVSKPVPDDPGRPAMPAGHPYCWQLLTDGTVLQGSPYPFPVFATKHR